MMIQSTQLCTFPLRTFPLPIYAFSLLNSPFALLRSRKLDNCRGISTNRPLFLQNKPNFLGVQMNVSANITNDYENNSNPTLGENKPNSNPNKPKTKPISVDAQTNVNSIMTKDYENICPCGAPKNKPNSNPIPQKPEMNVNSILTKDYRDQPLGMGGSCSRIKHQTRSKQRQFHEYGPFNGIVAIGLNHLKSQRYVQCSGRFHRRNSIQPHTGIADPSGLLNYGFREGSADCQAAELRPNVKSLHLTDTRTHFPQRHTSRRLPGIRGNQQAPFRRGVTVWKIGQFLFKVLKVQIEAQRSGIFPKQHLSQFKILTRSSLDNFQHRLLSARTCDGKVFDILTYRSKADKCSRHCHHFASGSRPTELTCPFFQTGDSSTATRTLPFACGNRTTRRLTPLLVFWGGFCSADSTENGT
jgi:hypothetical protein